MEIFQDDRVVLECSTLIMVPEIALSEPGHIRCLAAAQTGQSKHEFHALGQMALFRYEDGDLTITPCTRPLQIYSAGEQTVLESGILICRSKEGDLIVFNLTDHSLRKYFEAANRFCTRWVRLDI